MKIISGGQIGADIAGLKAAQELNFETGGWMPKGWLTLDGAKPEYEKEYGMTECSKIGYPARTRLNVQDGNVTVRFAYDFSSRGEICTASAIREFERPHINVPILPLGLPQVPPQYVAEWLCVYQPSVINIAGNATNNLEKVVFDFLIATFKWIYE